MVVGTGVEGRVGDGRVGVGCESVWALSLVAFRSRECFGAGRPRRVQACLRPPVDVLRCSAGLGT